MRLIGGATLVMLACVAAFWKAFKLLSFDPEFAASAGFSRVGLELLLNALLAFAVTLGLQLVGAVPMAALITAPAAAARQLSRSLGQMVGLAALFGALAGVAGAVVSSSVLGYSSAVALNVCIGGIMALWTGVFLLLAFLFGSRYGLLARSAARRRQGRENAARLLVGHLYHHERTAVQENTAAALREHLRWDAAKVAQVTAHALAEGLIGPTELRSGDRLTLTDTGRRLAREVWEPPRNA